MERNHHIFAASIAFSETEGKKESTEGTDLCPVAPVLKDDIISTAAKEERRHLVTHSLLSPPPLLGPQFLRSFY